MRDWLVVTIANYLCAMLDKDGLLKEAISFLQKMYSELGINELDNRLATVVHEIDSYGTYTHTFEELEHGARMAWRNSNRCIGRLYWKSLQVNDRRSVTQPEQVFACLTEHLERATNRGKILPMITIFPPEQRGNPAPVRIWNKQLIRYAGYRMEDGSLKGDPLNEQFTKKCIELGWEPGSGSFDVLPIMIQEANGSPQLYSWPEGKILEVPIQHPEYPALKDLGLKWHAVPVISDMVLEIGGIRYPAAPFNGWYMVTEIGSRNLGDEARYNQLEALAKVAGIETGKTNPFWKDKALVILNEAVYLSYRHAGVLLTDHHAASEQFMTFIRQEAREGREVKADWAWIVPPMSASTQKVFHEPFTNDVETPNFFYSRDAWEPKTTPSGCPFHIESRF
jgi:nitric-oxide synthase